MEAIGAAASVAGVLGFVGQSLNGIITIKRYVQAIKDAPRAAETVLRDINSVESVLMSIADLVNGFGPEPPTDARFTLRISSLEEELKRCLDEVQSWKEDEALRQSTEGSLRTALRRVKNGGYKDALEALARRITMQTVTLSFSLTALGRLNDQIAAEKHARFERELHQMSTAVDSLSDQVSSITTSLSSIVSSLSSRGDHQKGSSTAARRSKQGHMASLPSPLAYDPNLYAGRTDCYWTCDALDGTDDAFDHLGAQGYSRCKFCGEKFYWIDDECFYRQGKHLVERHAFGSCELGTSFDCKADFLVHVRAHHGFSTEKCSPADREYANQWIDLYFQWKGLHLGASSSPVGPSDSRRPADDKASTHHLILQQLEALLNSTHIKELEVPKRLRDSDQGSRTTSDWARQICVSLAALDDGGGDSIPGDRSDLRYAVGCLQEELSVLGFEDVLSLETYLSWDQTQLVQMTTSTVVSQPGTIRRLNTGWLLRDQLDRFATLGDVLMHCIRADKGLMRRFVTGVDTITEVVPRRLGGPIRVSNTYLQASRRKRGRVDPLNPHALELTDVGHLGDRRSRRFKRIDNWLLGIFIHSISMRRILMSGKAIPGLVPAEPVAWALDLVKHWDNSVNAAASGVRSSSRSGSEDLSYMDGATFGGDQTTQISSSAA